VLVRIARNAASARPPLIIFDEIYGFEADAADGPFSGLLTAMRDTFAADSQTVARTFRETLGTLRHGADVVRMTRAVAERADAPDIVGWCTEWLGVRQPLLTELESAMAWFADNPGLAMGPTVRDSSLAKLRQALSGAA